MDGAVGRDHLGDEPPGVRLGRGQLPVRRHPLEGAREAQQPVHEPGAARVGHEPDPDEAGDEGGGVRRDADVARGGEREARAGAGAAGDESGGGPTAAGYEARPVIAGGLHIFLVY